MPAPDHASTESDEFAAWHHAREREVPVEFGSREVLVVDRDRAFWVSGFRGHRTGFTFTTSYRWPNGATEHADLDDPDRWPDLTRTVPDGDVVEIEVVTDGHVRSNGAHGLGVLHPIGAGAMPGIATADWWVPTIPGRSLEIRFSHPSARIVGAGVVRIDGWPTAIEGGVVDIP